MATKGSERAAPVTRSLPHVVIVGGGFGGLYAARALAHRPVRVTLLDRRNHHLFQPLLYQVATAVLNASDIAVPLRSVLRRATNITVLLAEVEKVELANRRLVLDRGEMGYDALVLAAGASHSYFGHDEWEMLAPGLKTLEDALEIRRRVLLAYEAAEREQDGAERQALLTFVVVGGGPGHAAGPNGRRTTRPLRPRARRARPVDSGPPGGVRRRRYVRVPASDGRAAPRGGARGHPAGTRGRGQRAAATPRCADPPVSLPGQRQHGDHRARGGGRGGRALEALRARRVARLAVRPHHVLDRLSQPLPGAVRVGLGVRHVAPWRPADHRTVEGPRCSERSVALGQPQDVLGEIVEHHLLRDGRDLVEADLAPEPLDVELLGVAVAAVRLERRVARLEPRVRGEELRRVCLGAARPAVVEEPRGLQAHELGRLELGPRERQRMRDRLVLADRPVEDDTVLGVLNGALERGPPDPDGLDAGEDALGVERVQEMVEPAPLVADDVLGRHRERVDEDR